MFGDTCEFIVPILEDNIKDWSRLHIAGTNTYLTSQSTIDYVKRTPQIKLVLNPKVVDRKAGYHLPMVNIHKRGYYWTVQPDGSVSRFCKGSNSFEFDSSEYEGVIGQYNDFFLDNGLYVHKDDIYDASVRKIDISKILLLSPSVPLDALFEIFRKLDFGKRIENHDDQYYKQGLQDSSTKGLCVTYGTLKRKLASIYEKYPQLRQLKYKTFVEQELVAFLDANIGKTYQIIKFEECLYDKNRVKYVCNAVTGQKKKDYTFTDFWDRDLTRKILMWRGKDLFNGTQQKTLLLGNFKPNEIEAYLKRNNPKMQPQTIETIAFRAIQAHEHGFKGLKRSMSSYSKTTIWRRMEQIKDVINNLPKLPLQTVFDDMYRQLNELKPIRIKEDLLFTDSQAKNEVADQNKNVSIVVASIQRDKQYTGLTQPKEEITVPLPAVTAEQTTLF